MLYEWGSKRWMRSHMAGASCIHWFEGHGRRLCNEQLKIEVVRRVTGAARSSGEDTSIQGGAERKRQQAGDADQLTS